MNEIRKLKLSELIDMLSVNTAKYMKMLKDGYSLEEYDNCKKLIADLASEIEARKSTSNAAENPGMSNNRL